jgi:ABC-2 type transport system permease protein
MVALFSLGLGTILRTGAGGIAAALGVVLVLPLVFGMIPAEWAGEVSQFLLPNAGANMFMNVGGGLGYWESALVGLTWVVVSLAGAAALLQRRDA